MIMIGLPGSASTSNLQQMGTIFVQCLLSQFQCQLFFILKHRHPHTVCVRNDDRVEILFVCHLGGPVVVSE